MHPWYFFVLTFFFLEIACDESIGVYGRQFRQVRSPMNEGVGDVPISQSSNPHLTDMLKKGELNSSNANAMVVEEPPKEHTSLVKDKSVKVPQSSDTNQESSSGKGDSETKSALDDNKEEDNRPKFDEKAIQRALMVFGGVCTIILIYFGIKLILNKKKRAVRQYGLVESSEMDLLDHIEEESDEEEEEELFDVTTHRTQRR